MAKKTKMKMDLNFESYRDKVYACWLGKNIGGTMGTPYEGTHDILDIKGFVTKPQEVLPNDDLDLQLVWLHAVERSGPYAINAALLGEYWLSYIGPHWNEYGLGKANMKRGLLPPLSGDYENDWKHSNGAWIRTEVWACLAPAAPAVAAKYAIEDAVVDHGTGEGTYAAAFVAAMQSAAFVVSDIHKAIEIGLAYIPEDCRLAQSIKLLYECYENGVPPMEAREKIRLQNADIGDGWFEAPSNVTYAVLGMLYGEGDFKKSMILAINCGDDTDCTGATLGATLGILGGMKNIPSDWKAHLGDSIVTVSVDAGTLWGLPTTCTQLTDRVTKMAPVVLAANDCNTNLFAEKCEVPEDIFDTFMADDRILKHLNSLKPNSFSVDAPYMTVTVAYADQPEIAPEGECKLSITFKNKTLGSHVRGPLGNSPYILTLRWLGAEGFTIAGKQCVRMPHCNTHYPDASITIDVTIKAGEKVEPINRLVLEVQAVGRCLPTYIPVTLIG